MILTEKSVTGRSAWQRLFEEQMSAIEVSLDGETTTLEAALARLHAPDRDVRRTAAEAVTVGPAAGLAHPRVRAQHAARRQVDRRPAAPLRQLDREPQPLERGQRRVGAGARRSGAGPLLRFPQRWYALKAQPARHRSPRRLRPTRVGRRHRRARSAGRRPRSSCSTRTARSRASSPTTPGSSSTARGSTRPLTAGQAAGRVLRVHGAVAPSVLAVELDCAPCATCSRSRTSSVTGCTRTSHAGRACSTRSTPLTLAETASVFGETVTFGRLLGEVTDAARTTRAARVEPRGPDRDRVPSDGDEPLRGRDPQRAPR